MRYLAETTLALIEVLGHNVGMLHSDQEPVLVQLLKTVQSRRFERTSVRDMVQEPVIRVRGKLRT